MSRLDHIKVGDTVRLHGDRFVQGHVEGKVTEAFRHDLFRVEGDNWPSEAVLYETVTGLRALLGGSVYSLSDVEVVDPKWTLGTSADMAEGDPLDGMTPIADMHPITERGR